MTITLHWWLIPLAIVVCGWSLAAIIGSRAQGWDFVSPLVAFALFVGSTVAAVAFCVGRWIR